MERWKPNFGRASVVTCLLLALPLCGARPIVADEVVISGIQANQWQTAVGILIAVSLVISLVVTSAMCLCCNFKRSASSLTQQNGSQSAAAFQDGNSPSTEFTIFPPVGSQQLVHQRTSEDVKFEPLPDIHPRRQNSTPNNQKPRPATFSNVVSKGLSFRDWFEDPYSNFPRTQLQYVHEVGSGWFGQVVEGEAYGIIPNQRKTKVVVKILAEGANTTDQMYFLHEVRPFRDLTHPNVLKLLGKCLETDPFLIILEHCAFKDLKSYLIQHRTEAESLFQQNLLLRMICNVAAGLRHLHENGFILTDLAARNCVVSSDLVVKVGDYGSGIELYKGDYYCAGGIAVPVRWSAPETLRCTETIMETREVTREANIWSFGVVLWEILEFGKLPYIELSDDELIQKVIIDRTERLKQPLTPCRHINRLYQIIQLCQLSPKCRPAMENIHAMLAYLHSHKTEGGDSSAEFEARWHQMQPRRSPAKSVASSPAQAASYHAPATGDVDSLLMRELSPSPHPSLSNDSDFSRTAISPSLQNLRGSLDDLQTDSEGQDALTASTESYTDPGTVKSRPNGEPSASSSASLRIGSSLLERSSEKEVSPFTREVQEVIRRLDEDLDRECPSLGEGLLTATEGTADTRMDSSLLSDEAEGDSLGPVASFEEPAEDSDDEEDMSWKRIVECSTKEAGEITRIIREKSQSVQDFLKLTVIDSESGSDSDGVQNNSAPASIVDGEECRESQVRRGSMGGDLTDGGYFLAHGPCPNPLSAVHADLLPSCSASTACLGHSASALERLADDVVMDSLDEALSDLSLGTVTNREQNGDECRVVPEIVVQETSGPNQDLDEPEEAFPYQPNFGLNFRFVFKDGDEDERRQESTKLAPKDEDKEVPHMNVFSIATPPRPVPRQRTSTPHSKSSGASSGPGSDHSAIDVFPASAESPITVATTPDSHHLEDLSAIEAFHTAQEELASKCDSTQASHCPAVNLLAALTDLDAEKMVTAASEQNFSEDAMQEEGEPGNFSEMLITDLEQHVSGAGSTIQRISMSIPQDSQDDEKAEDDASLLCEPCVGDKTVQTSFAETGVSATIPEKTLEVETSLMSISAAVPESMGVSPASPAGVLDSSAAFPAIVIEESEAQVQDIDDDDTTQILCHFGPRHNFRFVFKDSEDTQGPTKAHNENEDGREISCLADESLTDKQETRIPEISEIAVQNGKTGSGSEHAIRTLPHCENTNECQTSSISDRVDKHSNPKRPTEQCCKEYLDAVEENSLSSVEGVGNTMAPGNLEGALVQTAHFPGSPVKAIDFAAPERRREEIHLVQAASHECQFGLKGGICASDNGGSRWLTELEGLIMPHLSTSGGKYEASEDGRPDLPEVASSPVSTPDLLIDTVFAYLHSTDGPPLKSLPVDLPPLDPALDSGPIVGDLFGQPLATGSGASPVSLCSSFPLDEIQDLPDLKDVEADLLSLDEGFEPSDTSPESPDLLAASSRSGGADEVGLLDNSGSAEDDCIMLVNLETNEAVLVDRPKTRLAFAPPSEDTDGDSDDGLSGSSSSPTLPRTSNGSSIKESLALSNFAEEDTNLGSEARSLSSINDWASEVAANTSPSLSSISLEERCPPRDARALNIAVDRSALVDFDAGGAVAAANPDESFFLQVAAKIGEMDPAERVETPETEEPEDAGDSTPFDKGLLVCIEEESEDTCTSYGCIPPTSSPVNGQANPGLDLLSPQWDTSPESSSAPSSCQSPSSASSTSGEFDCSKDFKFESYAVQEPTELNDVRNEREDYGEFGDDEEEDDDEDEDGGSDFVASTWNKDATPTKGLLKSEDRRHSCEEKKNVSFKFQKRSVIYEYPKEEFEEEEEEYYEDPNRSLWNFHMYDPQLDYSSYADWDLGDEEIPEHLVDVEDFEEGESLPEYASHPKYPEHSQTLYKLSDIPDEDIASDYSSEGGGNTSYYAHPDSFDFAAYLSHYNNGSPFYSAAPADQQGNEDFWLETILQSGDFFVSGSDCPFDFNMDGMEEGDGVPQWALSHGAYMYANEQDVAEHEDGEEQYELTNGHKDGDNSTLSGEREGHISRMGTYGEENGVHLEDSKDEGQQDEGDSGESAESDIPVAMETDSTDDNLDSEQVDNTVTKHLNHTLLLAPHAEVENKLSNCTRDNANSADWTSSSDTASGGEIININGTRVESVA